MSAARRARPAARTLRTAVRSAAAWGAVRTQPVSRPGRAAYPLARRPSHTLSAAESVLHACHPRKRGSAPPTARKRPSGAAYGNASAGAPRVARGADDAV